MPLLLDIHILLWYIEGNESLPVTWREQIQSPGNKNFVSIASLWEIAIKTNIGKLEIKYPLDQLIPLDFEILPVLVSHLLAYQKLPLYHRDPFDRILIAQAQTDDLTIMTKDPNFPLYEVTVLD